MKKELQKILVLIFFISLCLKVIGCFYSYASYDEKEYISTKNFYESSRPPLIILISNFFPNLIEARLFVAIFSSLFIFLIPLIEKEVYGKINLLPTIFIALNPLYIKLSSMFLTDSLFFSFLILFTFFMLRKNLLGAISSAIFSSFIRYEGFLLISIAFFYALREFIKRKDFRSFCLFLIFLIPVPLIPRMYNLYYYSHFLMKNAESPFWYYFITPFLIIGIFGLFLPFALKNYYKVNFFILVIFFAFYLFYPLLKVGGTFSDRFRYMLPTILPSSIWIGKYFEKKKNLFFLFILLNLIPLIFLFQDYREFRETIKVYFSKISIL